MYEKLWKNMALFLILRTLFINLKMFLVRQKYVCLEKKIVFDGKPKMTKKFEFEKLKIPNPDIWPILGDFQFFKFNFFVIFGFP